MHGPKKAILYGTLWYICLNIKSKYYSVGQYIVLVQVPIPEVTERPHTIAFYSQGFSLELQRSSLGVFHTQHSRAGNLFSIEFLYPPPPGAPPHTITSSHFLFSIVHKP